ncbi:hypothetical protein VE00_06308 [Pseudogymnoascus sp. WSF 3629]|nr:hypothetical protein VE00_06308 [Pseudogymnoascus sp. WSF 3629]
MSLHGLPGEIILNIISHVGQNESDLAALCLSSRHLRSLATPILYRKLCCRDDNFSDRRLVPLLLRSLLHDRALGGFVQELDISPRSCEFLGLSFTYEDKILVPKVVTEIVETGYFKQHYGFSATPAIDRWQKYRKWWEETWEGSWYAIITIIIFLCPGLRQIRCKRRNSVIPSDGEESYIEWFFRVVRHSQQAMRDGAIRTGPRELLEAQGLKSMSPFLPHLRHGRFTFKPEWGQPSDGVKLELLLFIQTPSVESLHLNGFVQRTQVRIDFLSGLKTLIMEQCVCEARVVGSILQACVRLEYFSYVHGHKEATINKFDTLLMMEGLLCLTGSLRQLRLARGSPLVIESNSASNSRLGSLAGLKVLTHLVLPVEFLVGMEKGTGPWDLELWKLVPRCLEYLLIGGLENEVMLAFAQQEVLELVKRKSIVAPKLNRIILQNISPVEADGSALTLLKEACGENQVWLSTYYGKQSEDEAVDLMLDSED